MFQRLEVLRPQEQKIEFYQGGVFYCSQACVKYFKIMDYINTKHTYKTEFKDQLYFVVSR